MAGVGQILRFGVRVEDGSYGNRSIMGGDAGGNTVLGIYGDGEGGAMKRGVIVGH